jgi:peptide/nickel transport system substrate-binding protein
MGEHSKTEQQKELFRLASRLSRREVLRRGLALGLSTPVIGYLLAACGGDDDDDDTAATATTSSDSAGTTPEAETDASPEGDERDATSESTGDTPWYVDPHPGPPQPGGMVNYLLYEDPDTLNPLIGGTGLALQPIVAMLEPLAETMPDGTWAPILAAEIPSTENGGVSEDLLTITWKLREGVLWHDGEPFTSDDVAFTWEAASSVEGGSIVASEFEKIVSVETPDDLTAVVTYSEFNVGFLDQFPYILPRHATGDVADMLNWDYNRAPVGTGPFKFEEWAAADHLTVLKNEDYREEGKPYLDGINFLVVPAEESRTAQMLQGDAHVMLWPGSEAGDAFEGSDVAQVRIAPGIWISRLHFNLSKPFDDDPSADEPHPLFGDVKVRQAIGLAINRDRIVNEVVDSTFLIDSILSVGWINASAEPWDFDPEAAKALLEEAGWVEGSGGIREKDGVKASFVCNGYTNFLPNELAQLTIQEDLANVGIEMKIENQDFAVIFGTWEDRAPRMTGDYDALFYDGGFFIEPHDSIQRQYHPSQVPGPDNPGGQNYWRWVREDVGEWIDAAGATPDIEERRANYQKVADAMREDVIMIPTFQMTEGSAFSTKLHGFVVSTWEYSTWDCENWWLEQ